MHRAQNIIQPVVSQISVPLHKRYFRFAQHRRAGVMRTTMMVLAVAALVMYDRVHPLRAA